MKMYKHIAQALQNTISSSTPDPTVVVSDPKNDALLPIILGISVGGLALGATAWVIKHYFFPSEPTEMQKQIARNAVAIDQLANDLESQEEATTELENQLKAEQLRTQELLSGTTNTTNTNAKNHTNYGAIINTPTNFHAVNNNKQSIQIVGEKTLKGRNKRQIGLDDARLSEIENGANMVDERLTNIEQAAENLLLEQEAGLKKLNDASKTHLKF